MQDEDNVYRQGGNTNPSVNPNNNSGQVFGAQEAVNPALPNESSPISDIQIGSQPSQSTQAVNTESQFVSNNLSGQSNFGAGVTGSSSATPTVSPAQGTPNTGQVSSSNFAGTSNSATTPTANYSGQQGQSFQQSPIVANSSKKGKALKVVAVMLLVLVALSGAGAAAYFGYVLPNKPENKLREALTNAFKEPPVSLKGSMDFKTSSSSSLTSQKDTTVAIDYNLSSVGENISLSGNVGFMGASFPFDSRYIDGDAYVKVGGLGFLSSLGGSSSSLSKINYSEISDKWFVINRSLLQNVEQTKCSAKDIAMSDSDVKAIEEIYKKYPLFTIESSSSDTIDNEAVTKMQIKPKDEATSNSFGKELNNLDKIKKIKSCISGESTDATNSSSVDEEIVPDEVSKADTTLLVYVTSKNKVKRIELKGSDSETTVNMSMNMDWTPVTITKPDGAKPIQDVLPVLMNSYSGLSGTSSSY